MRSGPGLDDPDRVELGVPADARVAGTLRLVAASIAADLGFSVDEIDDLRLGLNELFSLVADQHPGKRIVVSFVADERALRVAMTGEEGPLAIVLDDLAARILAIVVDELALDGGTLVIAKRASESAPSLDG